MEASNALAVRRVRFFGLRGSIRRPAWAPEAWASIAVVALFIGVVCWWLSVDRSIPIFDAGLHLSLAVRVYEQLRVGHLDSAFTLSTPYPPFAYLVGALGLWIGGFSAAAPIVAENVVFVSLLALGCYNVGRLAFSPRVGLLAVIFALGSPLIAAQFHVFMTDAPEASMVAVSVWLILATERFSRVWVCLAAGVAVGLGQLTKEPFGFFVAGIVLVTLIKGGWREWRGLAVFAVVALAISMPWYVNDFTFVEGLAQGASHAGANTTVGEGYAPPRFSSANLLWYFWNFVDFQAYLPLFIFSAVGGVWTIVGFVRRRPVSPLAWELTIGAFVAWLAITETFVHDTRYSMPILLYLAVFGTFWIVRIPVRAGRLAATAALVLIVVANTIGLNFGVGKNVRITLPGAEAGLLNTPGLLTIYTDEGFLVRAPHRDGNVLALLQALRRDGMREVAWFNFSQDASISTRSPDFSAGGILAFAALAKLTPITPTSFNNLGAHTAILGHGKPEAGEAPPCVKLSDGTGVWVRLGSPSADRSKDYCPYRHPVFYG